jgi:hypothetical protein
VDMRHGRGRWEQRYPARERERHDRGPGSPSGGPATYHSDRPPLWIADSGTCYLSNCLFLKSFPEKQGPSGSECLLEMPVPQDLVLSLDTRPAL